MFPPAQTFTTFPNKELALADLARLTTSSFYARDESFQSKVDYYIAEIQKSDLNLVALRDFFKYNDMLDRSRDIKLNDYIPELEACRNYITKLI